MGTKKVFTHRNRRFSQQSISYGGSPLSNTYVKAFDFDYHEGADNPNFRNSIKQGSSCTNSYLAIRRKYERTDGLIMGISKSPIYQPLIGWDDMAGLIPLNQGVDLVVPSITAPSSLLSQVENEARIGIRKKINAEYQAFNGLQFLGELRENVRMLRNPALALRQYVNQFIERTPRKRKRFGKTLAESWLEFSFGAKPLMNDISDIAQSALKISEDTIKRVSYIANGSSATTTVKRAGATFGITEYENHTIHQIKVKYVCGIKTESNIGQSGLQKIVNSGGFDLTSVIPATWELIPWSFLIDYFTNIGDVLEATCTSMKNVKWTSHTVVYQQIHMRCGAHFKWTSQTALPLNMEMPSDRLTTTKITRDSDAPGFPSVNFHLPGRAAQFLNMAALYRARRY